MPEKLKDKTQTPARLGWIDNLRTFIIFLVVSMHACVTYSYVGGWYINYPPGPSPFEHIVFILWQAHLQSFFMGLLFFLAGVFAHRAIQKRGPGDFMKERFLRLGVPSICYMVLMQPFIIYVLLQQPAPPNRPNFLTYWWDFLSSGKFLGGSGPMWFAVALWIFCCLYTAKYKIWGKAHSIAAAKVDSAMTPAPSTKKLWLLGIVLVCGSFLVRLAFPLGSNLYNMQLGFFTQYVSVFALGIIADRKGWFEALVKSKQARLAGWLGILIGPVFLVCLVMAGGPPPKEGPIIYSGGWNPWAFGLAFWEQFTGLAIALGIMSWFYKYGNSTHHRAIWLSRRSFGVYMLHSPIMVFFTPFCNPIADKSRLIAALILTAVSLVVSYITTDLVIRIPGLKKFI